MKSLKTVTISKALANAIKDAEIVADLQIVWDDIRESKDTTLFEEVCKIALELGMVTNSMALMYLVSTKAYETEKKTVFWVVYGQLTGDFYVRDNEFTTWYKQVKIKQFDNTEDARSYVEELNQLNADKNTEV